MCFRPKGPVSRTPENGFVLIEMIVTVALIALLFAILAPVMAQARLKVTEYDCSNRQRQLGRAILMYTGDCDEGLPVCAAFNRRDNTTIGSWDAGVAPYASIRDVIAEPAALAQSAAIFRCPADFLHREVGITRSFAMPLTGSACMGPNQGVAGNWVYDLQSLYRRPRYLAELPAQSATLLLVEFFHPLNRLFGGWAAGIHGPIFAPGACGTGPLSQEPQATYNSITTASTDRKLPSRFGGFNYTFCDSHAKWLRPSQTLGPKGKPGDPQGAWTIADSD